MASSGVNLPVDEKGVRGTTAINQGAFVAAVKNVDPTLSEEVKSVKNWRKGYTKHVLKQVECAVKSKENALKIANDGLDYLHSEMVFERDGVDIPLKEAMKKFTRDSFETGFIQGTGDKSVLGKKPYEVPYHDKVLSKNALIEQIDKWVRLGTIEGDCGQSLLNIVKNPEWTDLSAYTFVLFGAGSAMGPYPLLMSMGANVIALDLDRPNIWDRLFKIAKESPGTLTFPMKSKATTEDEMKQVAGCDFISKAPEVRNWLVNLKTRERLICGAYAYLDGPMFLRVSMAMDAIIQDLMLKRSVKIGVAYLCTPTDAHPVSYASNVQAIENNKKSPAWMKLVGKLIGLAVPKRGLIKNARKPIINDEGEEIFVNDSTVSDQGPNYILAKRLQHWRAIVAKEAGCLVSTNVAPATSTASVVSNKAFALAYEGFKRFKPMEVFKQETSNSVMAALLVNDIKNPISVSQPERKLKNPMEIFSENAFHGGCWRCGYKYDSIGWTSGLSVVWMDYIVKFYLVLYNLFQFYGWTTITIYFSFFLFDNKDIKESGSLWSIVGKNVTYFQWLMWLELFHGLLGFTRADAFTTGLQVWSRINLVSSLNWIDTSKTAPLWCTLMIFAWGVTEIIRYSFFATNLLNIKLYPLLWCRYTFFIILYPMGVAGEMGNVWYLFEKIHKYKGSDPSLLLSQFMSKYVGYTAVVILYSMGLPFLYGHLLMQRGTQLKKGKGTSKKVKSA